jgi:hypothetical protein
VTPAMRLNMGSSGSAQSNNSNDLRQSGIYGRDRLAPTDWLLESYNFETARALNGLNAPDESRQSKQFLSERRFPRQKMPAGVQPRRIFGETLAENLLQCQHHGAQSDQRTARKLRHREPLSQKKRCQENHENHAQLIDGRYL